MKKKASVIEKIKIFLLKAGVSLATIIIALIPTWLYLLANYAFEPTDALAKILLFGVGLHFLGGVQVILLIFGAIFIGVVITTK